MRFSLIFVVSVSISLIGCGFPFFPTNPPEKFGYECGSDDDCAEASPEHVDLLCLPHPTDTVDGGQELRCSLECDSNEDCPYQDRPCYWTVNGICEGESGAGLCKPSGVACE